MLESFILKIENFNLLSKSEIIDYVAYYLIKSEKKESIRPVEITNCFRQLNIPPYENMSRYLSNNSKGRGNKKFIKNKKDASYVLTRNEIERIELNLNLDTHFEVVNITLRSLSEKLNSDIENIFLTEAILTFEVGAYRAAIIMVWLLTIDHMYEYILANKLQEFIDALRKMNNKTNIYTKDDFSSIKENMFIQACKSGEIITNDVMKILESSLSTRNSFAHPSTVELPKSKALSFIEDLVINVILKYPI